MICPSPYRRTTMVTRLFQVVVSLGFLVFKNWCWHYHHLPPVGSGIGRIPHQEQHWHTGRLARTSSTVLRLFNTGDGDGDLMMGAASKLSDLLGGGSDDSEKEFYRVQLDLEIERQLILRGEPPIATLTWFDFEEDQTSQDAVDFFQERANQIVLANPWLQSGYIKRNTMGLLMKGEGENTAPAAELVYTTTLDEYPKIEIASVKDAQQLQFYGPDLPIQAPSQYDAAVKYTRLQGERRKGGPLWRITVVPSYGSFGLILSISHFVADIHTYYKIFDMLTCPYQEIGPLDLSTPYVQTEDGDCATSDELAQFHVGGPRVWKLIHSPWVSVKGALGILERNFWRPLADGPTKSYTEYDEYGIPIATVRRKRRNQGAAYWFEVDHYELNRVKETLVWEGEEKEALVYGTISDRVVLDEFRPDSMGRSRSGPSEHMTDSRQVLAAVVAQSPSGSQGIPNVTAEKKVTFVSTNDILSSWFFQMTRCRMGLISCNYRGKLQGHHEYLARNYWGAYALAPDQFKSPLDIRLHIQQPTASRDQFPVLAAELLKPRPLATVSSWTLPTSASQLQQQQELRRQQQQPPPQQQFPTCQQTSHWPLFDFPSDCPSNFVVLRTWWIQRPSPDLPNGRIGVYVAGDATWLVEPMEFWSMIPSFLIEFPST